MTFIRITTWLLVCVLLASCGSRGHRAPVYERAEAEKRQAAEQAARDKKSQGEKDWRPKIYIVQKGDTLYSIAFNYGLDYHELAELNGIKNPKIIAIGQEIRLFPGNSAPGARTVSSAESLIKEQPRLVKYPYSEAAMAHIEKVQEQKISATTTASTNESKPEVETETTVEVDEAALEWSMPTQGKIIAKFSESANRKGIDIAGKLGQPVVASAAGKVVYSGSGLRGYGKLIIIKHNKTYLSAYAHNDKIMVKEGQNVTRGQQIAAMGNTDASEVKLHFEIRRLGKPVDPAKFLPLGKGS